MEMRKHFSAMSQQEIDILKRIVRNNTYAYTAYSIRRVMKRKIIHKDIFNAIKEGRVIELHIKDNSLRILVRGRANRRKKCACVVLDITNNTIVTSYENYRLDNHKTLDKSLYIKDIDVYSVVKPYII